MNPNNDLLHISEEGHDALTADLKYMILDSRYPLLKIVLGNDPSHFKFEEYTFQSEPADNSTATLFDIPHPYTYVPAAIVQMVMDSSDNIVNLPFIQQAITFEPPSTFGTFEDRFYYEVDDSNLYIKFKRTLTAGSRPGGTDKNGTTWGFKRQIFAESGLDE